MPDETIQKAIDARREIIKAEYLARITEKTQRLARRRLTPVWPATVREWDEFAGALRERLKRDIFNFPENPGPLREKIVGIKEYPRFIFERIIFFSEPGSAVTANLYRPKSIREKAPALIVASGTGISKVEEINQAAGQIYAQGGAMVLIPDTLGEGDRRGSGFHGGWIDECREIGREFMGKAVFDLIRCADYLATRPEVDMSRLGITGHSLGGFFAAFSAALDERFTAAIPASSSIAGSWATLPTGVGCHFVYGLGQLAETVEILGLITPRALCLIQGTEDFVPIAVVRENVELLKRLYQLYGRVEQFQFVELTGVPHGAHFLRKTCVQWFKRRLDLPNFTESQLAEMTDRPGDPQWVDWARQTPFLDVPLQVLPYTVTYTYGAYGCSSPELDCLSESELTNSDYTVKRWLDRVRKDIVLPKPSPKSWAQWESIRARWVEEIIHLLGIRFPGSSEVVEVKGTRSERGGTLYDLKHPPTGLGSFVWMPPVLNSKSSALVYLNQSRTRDGGFASEIFEQGLREGRVMACLDAIWSEAIHDRDVFIGESTTTANVRHVLDLIAWLRGRGINSAIAIVGEVDDVTLWSAAVDEGLNPISLNVLAGTETWKDIPKDWIGVARYEGTVPRKRTVIDRDGLLALLVPRKVILNTDETITDLGLYRAVTELATREEKK